MQQNPFVFRADAQSSLNLAGIQTVQSAHSKDVALPVGQTLHQMPDRVNWRPVATRSGSNLSHSEERLHRRPVPPHLLLLVHPLGHDLVDRTLDKRGRGRFSASTPGGVVTSAPSFRSR